MRANEQSPSPTFVPRCWFARSPLRRCLRTPYSFARSRICGTTCDVLSKPALGTGSTLVPGVFPTAAFFGASAVRHPSARTGIEKRVRIYKNRNVVVAPPGGGGDSPSQKALEYL